VTSAVLSVTGPQGKRCCSFFRDACIIVNKRTQVPQMAERGSRARIPGVRRNEETGIRQE
jgi:hypothetical protein